MKKKDGFIAIIGVLVLGIGLVLVKTMVADTGVMAALPYVLVGIGSGVFGHGASGLIAGRAIAKDAELQKQIEIESKDERNIAIANKAKAKAYDFMTMVFGMLMISFALMNVNIAQTLLLVAAYLLVHGYGIYYRMRYEKEM